MINITYENFGEAPFNFHGVRHWLPWCASDTAAASVRPTQAPHP